MKNYKNLSKMHLFFVGIGGISMSGLAKMLIFSGAKVSGSDIGGNNLEELKSLGATIYNTHDSSHITPDIDLIVFSSAINKDNVEIIKGNVLNIPTLERHELLGLMCQNYSEVIAVAGTHGKTTVTSMIGHIFQCAKLHPTIHIGGESVNLKGNTVIGDNKYLIVEACEYRDSFLSITPSTALILNIDLDHTDYYKSYSQLNTSFEKFGNKAKFLIKNIDVNVIHNQSEIVDKDWCAKNIKKRDIGYTYDIYYQGKYYLKANLHVIGRHNITNSLFAVAVAHRYNIPKRIIKKGLATYLGVRRRYEYLGKINKIPVIIDYAHHPTEIIRSLEGIREVYNNPLVIFQPHTYSRTESLLNNFKVSLGGEDVIIYKTYPAREKFLASGSAFRLYRILENKVKFYAKDINSLKAKINDITSKSRYDVIIVLGAGDLADKIVRLINSV